MWRITAAVVLLNTHTLAARKRTAATEYDMQLCKFKLCNNVSDPGIATFDLFTFKAITNQ